MGIPGLVSICSTTQLVGVRSQGQIWISYQESPILLCILRMLLLRKIETFKIEEILVGKKSKRFECNVVAVTRHKSDKPLASMGRTKGVLSDIVCTKEAGLRAGKITIKGPFNSLKWPLINNSKATQYLPHSLPSLCILGKQRRKIFLNRELPQFYWPYTYFTS